MKKLLISLTTMIVLCLIIAPGAMAVKKRPKLQLPKDASIFSSKIPANYSFAAVRAVDTKFITPNGAKLFEANPIFEWNSPKCNSDNSCKVLVDYIAKDKKNQVIKEDDKVTKNKYTLVNNADKIKQGESYQFSVNLENSKDAGDADVNPMYFYSLSIAEREALKTDLANIKEEDKLDRTIEEINVLVDKGVWFDAVEKLDKLISENPDDNEIKAFKLELYDMVKHKETDKK